MCHLRIYPKQATSLELKKVVALGELDRPKAAGVSGGGKDRWLSWPMIPN